MTSLWFTLHTSKNNKIKLHTNRCDEEQVSKRSKTLNLKSPFLLQTVHKAARIKQPPAESCPAEDILHPVSKEAMLLNFNLEMRREEDLGENEEKQGGEGGDNQEEVCPTENGEKEQGKDLLIVSMVKTSISVVAGRSCDTGIPCPGCVETECTLNDVVMVSESSSVTLGKPLNPLH